MTSLWLSVAAAAAAAAAATGGGGGGGGGGSLHVSYLANPTAVNVTWSLYWYHFFSNHNSDVKIIHSAMGHI